MVLQSELCFAVVNRNLFFSIVLFPSKCNFLIALGASSIRAQSESVESGREIKNEWSIQRRRNSIVQLNELKNNDPIEGIHCRTREGKRRLLKSPEKKSSLKRSHWRPSLEDLKDINFTGFCIFCSKWLRNLFDAFLRRENFSPSRSFNIIEGGEYPWRPLFA